MADRYRDRPPENDYGRDDYNRAPQHPAESDPLAELARLIGQTDPFSTFGREQQQPPQYNERADHYPSDDPAAGYDEQPVGTPAWMRNLTPPHDAYGTQPANDPYADARGYDQQPSGQEQGRDGRYEDVLYGQPPRDPRHDTPFQVQDEHYDEFDRPYDDEHNEPKSRRGGTMTVVVVLALAVVGTAAAFGYRTFVGSPRSGEPPVIKADTGPNKIMSAGSGDKQITDRLGDKPAERVVSREEQPVDINGKAQPRVVFPALTQNATPPNVTSANTATRPTGAGVGNGTLGGEEPRKIRTLSIRPGETGDATATAAPAAAAPVRQIAPAAAAPRAAAAAASGGPISLSPQGAAPAAVTQPRVASVAPAAAPASGGSGSYVQVSSQKTEADAQASFKAIQAKYSGILGGKPSSIRRADLGDKGVFYRAVVGPFASTDEATQFCVNLKSAGGQCLVQR